MPALLQRCLVAAALLTVLCGPALAQDKVLLRVKADAGAEARYSSESKIDLSGPGGVSLNFIAKEESMVKAVKVENGLITFDRTVLKSSTIIDGEEEPDELEGEQGSITVVKPNGETVSYKDKDPSEDPESAALTMRLVQAASLIFSEKEVGVGESWSHTFAANKELGFVAAKASYKLAAFETIDGVKTAKIEVVYEEIGGAQAIKSSGLYWVEIASGDAVKVQVKLDSLPFPMGPGMSANAKVETAGSRTSGSPLAGQGKPVEATPAGQPAKPAESTAVDAKVKDFEKMPGLFTLYRKVDNGRTRLFLEIKKDQLNKKLLLQATAATGTTDRMVTGNPISDTLFELREMPNNRIYLMVPNFSYRARPGSGMAQAIERSFAESAIDSYEIEARQGDRLLIDISGLFLGNFARITDALQAGGNPLAALLGGGGGVSLDREKTFLKTIKAFPTNIYAETVYSVTPPRTPSLGELAGIPTVPDNRNFLFRVVYNLWMLPTDNGYMPRRFDGRVGYFTSDYIDMTNDVAKDMKVMNIWRWDLRKKDPAAAVSEPVQPIVFWIDNAVPNQYRQAVREGLLVWNKAFEAAGFKNAVVVKDMPDNADWDPADMRYNVVRWVTSPEDAYAVALARTNPLTGQILNATILVDAGMTKFTALEFDENVDPASYFRRLWEEPKDAHSQNCLSCRNARESARLSIIANVVMDMVLPASQAKERRAEYLHQFVRHVVSHEFGHIVGLRHNFISSTQLSLAEMGDRGKVSTLGTSASVMDYVPFNTEAVKRPGVDFYSSGPGQYDIFAIRYGYTPSTSRNPDDEAPMLRAIIREGARMGLEWQSDEQADAIDPYVTRFDLSKNPLDYWQRTMEMSRYLLMNLDQRKPESGQSYAEFTDTFMGLYRYHARAASQATKFIGGVRRSRTFRGDPNERAPMLPVPAGDQRRALGLLISNVFSEQAYNFPKSYFKKFTDNPKGNFLEGLMAASNDYPMLTMFSSTAASAINTTLSNGVLNRLVNQEFEAEKGETILTARELMERVTGAVWSEVGARSSVTMLRRQLQRDHVERLIALGVRAPGSRSEINVLAWNQLRSILGRLQNASGRDEATQGHYADLRARITRALNSIETLGQAAPAGGGIDLTDLLGGRRSGG